MWTYSLHTVQQLTLTPASTGSFINYDMLYTVKWIDNMRCVHEAVFKWRICIAPTTHLFELHHVDTSSLIGVILVKQQISLNSWQIYAQIMNRLSKTWPRDTTLVFDVDTEECSFQLGVGECFRRGRRWEEVTGGTAGELDFGDSYMWYW